MSLIQKRLGEMKQMTLIVMAEATMIAFGLLILTPSADPITVGKAGNHFRSALLQSDSVDFQGASKSKPLAIWECTTGWYGEPFDGQETADGETYDMYGITAAHPTLPLGSIVRIVNQRNHRSQIVRINDRGPYVEGRELDVSYEVARRLGFDQRGLAKVRVELLRIPSHPGLNSHLGF
jgi:hypothetical protein